MWPVDWTATCHTGMRQVVSRNGRRGMPTHSPRWQSHAAAFESTSLSEFLSTSHCSPRMNHGASAPAEVDAHAGLQACWRLRKHKAPSGRTEGGLCHRSLDFRSNARHNPPVLRGAGLVRCIVVWRRISWPRSLTASSNEVNRRSRRAKPCKSLDGLSL